MLEPRQRPLCRGSNAGVAASPRLGGIPLGHLGEPTPRVSPGRCGKLSSSPAETARDDVVDPT